MVSFVGSRAAKTQAAVCCDATRRIDPRLTRAAYILGTSSTNNLIPVNSKGVPGSYGSYEINSRTTGNPLLVDALQVVVLHRSRSLVFVLDLGLVSSLGLRYLHSTVLSYSCRVLVSVASYLLPRVYLQTTFECLVTPHLESSQLPPPPSPLTLPLPHVIFVIRTSSTAGKRVNPGLILVLSKACPIVFITSIG